MKKQIATAITLVALVITNVVTVFAAESNQKPDVIIDNGTGYTKFGTGSIISSGNIWIIISIVVVIIVLVALIIIYKKKKK